MKRSFLVGCVLILGVGLFLYHRGVRGNADPVVAATSSQTVTLDRFRTVESRGRHVEPAAETNEAQLRISASPAKIADGEWLLSFSLAEPQMVLWALTNASIPVPEAKGLLRPALEQLYAGVFYRERLAELEVKEIAEMKAIRENDDYSKEDKIGFTLVKAAAFRGSREKWVSDRDEWLKSFTSWITSLGVKDPLALRRDLLLIQPATPPPDPKQ